MIKIYNLIIINYSEIGPVRRTLQKKKDPYWIRELSLISAHDERNDRQSVQHQACWANDRLLRQAEDAAKAQQ